MDLTQADKDAVSTRHKDAAGRMEQLRGRNLSLDMTRGKPSPEQLDLADELLNIVKAGETTGEDGTDLRNYGGLAGIPEARRLFAEFLGTEPDRVIVGGNSSLTMMWDVLSNAMMFGMPGGEGSWREQAPKFICPVPGYDRHFAICERLGIEMITVEMTPDGPDLDAIRALVAEDASVKGIWCVPKYSNPSGETYSDETVEALASMPVAAADFRIMWDNAYAVHHLGNGPASLSDILTACEKAGNPNRAIVFGSTSKITHAGAGVAVMASSPDNVKDHLDKIFFSMIGPDKINQLRHVRFFKDMDGILAHMQKHAEIVAPKFAAVDEALEKNLGGTGLASWTKPEGGYFVSVDVLDGCASKVIARCADAGVKITPAGATYPYGKDPHDRNIRIAPTLPSVDEIKVAMTVLTAAIEEVCTEKLLKG
ncbi:MAG: aminotransferase class I/II-fold pyridoxal phosphate-dependent enzyme [Rhodospirillales bacterium]|nr:aminotransferase class I/II-fold pyridoxal phosphate-dependent enzyme [Rhodospirillales bacterium]MBO6787453.1 aminotransferase class I/II-fold pyridoxal phosphate-dependent enzyme [Rhodospirillales bacterium]